MSDITGTVVKLLSSLASPKSSFKIILIATSIILFWRYLQPELLSFKLPSELTSLVTLLVGVGIGSLFCDLIFFLLNALYKTYQRVQLKKVSIRETEREKEKLLEQEKEFIDKFKEAYEHYDLPMKKMLRELVSENKSYPNNNSEMTSASSLYSNKLISRVSRIDGSKFLYAINPLILSHVKDEWVHEIEKGIDDFLSNMTPLKVDCLNLLELSDSSFDGKLRNLKKSAFGRGYELHPVILNTFDTPEESFYLYFNQDYLKAFETRLSRQFADEIEVKLK